MGKDFQYKLEPNSKKFNCPGCGKRRLVRYIDQATGEYLPDHFGRCDREINCGYWLNPYKTDYWKDHKAAPETIHWTPPPPPAPRKPSFIHPDIFKASRAGYHENSFVKWLTTLFDVNTVNNLIANYFIGTSNHWPGAVVFWQIDQSGRIRTGKIMGYNSATGHRIKEPSSQIQWVHNVLKLETFNLKQCYFGEHLLKLEPQKPVALVESEKTAIVASAYFPGFVWLAVGSLTNINAEKCKPLAGRRVILFPDLGGFDKWTLKVGGLNQSIPGARFDVSDILERGATPQERIGGFDLCDYLTRFDVSTFAGEPSPGNQSGGSIPLAPDHEPGQPEQLREIEPKSENSEFRDPLKTNRLPLAEPKQLPTIPQKKTLWPVDELETFFAGVQLPKEPIRLNRWTLIADVQKFVSSHIAQAKANNGNPTFRPGFDSLTQLREMLSVQKSENPMQKGSERMFVISYQDSTEKRFSPLTFDPAFSFQDMKHEMKFTPYPSTGSIPINKEKTKNNAT